MAYTEEELIQQLADIEEEMQSESSVSVDGKITVKRREMKDLMAIYAKEKYQLDKLQGNTTGTNIAKLAKRGGFE